LGHLVNRHCLGPRQLPCRAPTYKPKIAIGEDTRAEHVELARGITHRGLKDPDVVPAAIHLYLPCHHFGGHGRWIYRDRAATKLRRGEAENAEMRAKVKQQ